MNLGVVLGQFLIASRMVLNIVSSFFPLYFMQSDISTLRIIKSQYLSTLRNTEDVLDQAVSHDQQKFIMI